MEKLNLCDLCIIARSLYVDFSKLTYEEGGVSYLSNVSGRVKADFSQIELSDAEYEKLSILIRVLQDIYECRPLPF